MEEEDSLPWIKKWLKGRGHNCVPPIFIFLVFRSNVPGPIIYLEGPGGHGISCLDQQDDKMPNLGPPLVYFFYFFNTKQYSTWGRFSSFPSLSFSLSVFPSFLLPVFLHFLSFRLSAVFLLFNSFFITFCLFCLIYWSLTPQRVGILLLSEESSWSAA